MCLLVTGGQTDRQKITNLIFSPPFRFSDGGIKNTKQEYVARKNNKYSAYYDLYDYTSNNSLFL